MENNNNENQSIIDDDEIVINMVKKAQAQNNGNRSAAGNNGKRSSRMSDSINKNKNKKNNKGHDPKKVNDVKYGKNGKPKWSVKKKILVGILSFLLAVVLILGAVLGVYIVKSDGNVVQAVLNAATDVVGTQDPVFVLILGVSEDISTELTDTIILCGYNPQTQNAFMLSIPRDTYIGTNPSSANGYNKINALFQKSAQTTIEAVENLTGINIDYYVVIRNISISSIFQCIGNVEFDVPIDMNYDDPTQDLHIHLSKGYQTLTPDQVEQLLRFRHNNDGTSYPSSYGDNDYGRMKTQREFIKSVVSQITSMGSVGKIKDIASMIYPNLQTNMSGYTVLEYVPYGLQINTAGIKSEQLPGQSALINSLWFYKANKSKTQDLVDDLIDSLGMSDEEKEKHYTGSNNITDFVTPQTTETKTDENGETHTYELIGDTSTCTDSGIQTYKCTDCGATYTKEVGASGHNYDSNGQCTKCLKYKPTINNNTTNTDSSKSATSSASENKNTTTNQETNKADSSNDNKQNDNKSESSSANNGSTSDNKSNTLSGGTSSNNNSSSENKGSTATDSENKKETTSSESNQGGSTSTDSPSASGSTSDASSNPTGDAASGSDGLTGQGSSSLEPVGEQN